MRLSFDTIEELLAFVERLKKPRGGKNNAGDDDNAGGAVQGQPAGGGAPAPIMPQGGAPAFGSGAPAFTAPGGSPFGGGPMVAPEIVALVGRITATVDKALAGGQNVDQVLGWFRTEITKGGVDATNATMDQIKTTLLAKLPQPALENIAKLTGA